MNFKDNLLQIVLTLLITFSALAHSKDTDAALYTSLQYGDAQRCPQQIDIMETLPGFGFDNLNNKVMGKLLVMNYSQCRVSSDRKYLIPDNVFVVPVRESHLKLYSEIIDSWQNYTSTTSKTINADASVSFLSWVGISGSYSSEHESVRKSMVEDKTVTVRAQLRNYVYRVIVEPDTEITAIAKNRLLDIASHHQRNDSYMATYLAQIFVRDYGTHYTKSIDAGGILAQEDQISLNYAAKYSEDKSKVTAAASGSFLGIIKASGSVTTTHDATSSTEYMKNRKKSDVQTFGGPAFRINFTLNEWEDGLQNNLVAIDKGGDPIWYIITPAVLPELPEDTIQSLSDLIEEQVRQYYLHNIHRGCTKIDSKNFDPMANFNDGNCEPPNTNYTFGGVYQTCSGPSDFCSKNTQVNPKTNTFSCPKPYTDQLIYSFQGPRECTQHCHGWWVFRSCDWTCTHGTVNAYWCYALDKVPQESGYLFGGVYTPNTVNLATQNKNCPKMFYPLRFVDGWVCVSDDYELGYRFAYPFGGFISCKHGNPLSQEKATRKFKAAPNSLKSFFSKANDQNWPKHCPKGYSQHLMQISHGCEINYCVQKNYLTNERLPLLRRPPYVTRPVPITNNSMYLLTKSGVVWKKIEPAHKWEAINLKLEQASLINGPMSMSGDGGTTSSSLGTGGTVVITMVTTIIAAILVWVAVMVIARYRQRQNDGVIPSVTHTGGGRGLFRRREAPLPNTEDVRVSVNESSTLI